MTDRSNYEEVQVEKASLDKTFMSYSKCCKDIKDCLCEGEVTELREIAKGYTNVCNAKEHLDRKLGEWIAIADVDLKTNFKERFEPSELMTFRVNEQKPIKALQKPIVCLVFFVGIVRKCLIFAAVGFFILLSSDLICHMAVRSGHLKGRHVILRSSRVFKDELVNLSFRIMSCHILNALRSLIYYQYPTGWN